MKYYLHDSNSFNDDKITQLFIKFGYEGLGLFYTLLEKFAQQEKPIKTEVLKIQLRIGKKLEKVWKFMEEIELISSNNGETFNKQLLNYSETYQIKKEKNRIKLLEWREKQEVVKNVTSYEPSCNSPKVKESKVNENKEIINNVVSYLNLKLKTTFKNNSKKTVDCINARLNENFTYDDFVLVIDYKAKEWKSTEFEKFLRPETLFGNKFEGYLQASKITTNKQNNISNDRKGKSSFEIIKSLGENFK